MDRRLKTRHDHSSLWIGRQAVPVESCLPPSRPRLFCRDTTASMQWRRPRSTWYGQLRFAPWLDDRYECPRPAVPTPWSAMSGTASAGLVWTEWLQPRPWRPRPGSQPPRRGCSASRSMSSLVDWVQGWSGGWRRRSFATEVGRLSEGTWLENDGWNPLAITADVGDKNSARARKARWPNRWGPGLLVPLAFCLNTRLYGTTQSYWSMGVANPGLTGVSHSDDLPCRNPLVHKKQRNLPHPSSLFGR